MSKIIYLIKIPCCTACRCQQNIFETVLKEYEDVKLEILSYSEVPEWIKVNATITDFPASVITENDVIKYHFMGTKSVKKVKAILTDIGW